MNKLYILLFSITSIVYSECSFTMMDEYKARYKEKCLDNKILSDKRCSYLGSYIKRCGVAVLTLDVQIMPSGEIISNLPQKTQPTPAIQALKPKKASVYNLITYLMW